MLLVQKMCGVWNKMWKYFGLPVLLLAIAVQCIETELSREAAFQGRCGHGSPCEQLCYELHDGMYECDCTEGYELNKNGYSCQVINSTYQSNDLSSGTEEDVLYQSDASFSAKLDNSYSHNNKQNSNKNVSNGDYSQSSSSVNNSNRNSKNSRYNKNNIVKNISKQSLNKQLSKYETSKSMATKQATGGSRISASAANQNTLHINDDKMNVDFYNTIIDWKQNADVIQPDDAESTSDNDNNVYGYNGYNVGYNGVDASASASDDNDDDEEDDLDYNGNSSSGSDSIVIKIATKDGNSSKLADNPDTNKLLVEQSFATAKISSPAVAAAVTPASVDSNIGTVNAPSSTATSNYNYNNENYYSKDDMSIYDDVNNNRLNLRSNPIGHANAYEERNIYVANNVLSDTTNDSVKSYIHIEVYKGNLDGGSATAKPKDMKSINAFDGGKSMSAKSTVQLHLSKTDGKTEIPTTKPEPCLLDCGLDGLCDNSEKTIRCRCPFGKNGNKCENVADSVSTPRFTKHSWIAFSALRGAYKHVQMHIEFKPESNNGIILLTGERDDLSGDFLAVLIDQGHIEFWFDCGSGTGKVRSDTEVTLNQWNTLTVYRYRWDAWIQLNNGQRVQGRSKVLVESAKNKWHEKQNEDSIFYSGSELPLSMEQWHIIRISRTARLAVMKIDQLSEVMTVSPNGFWHLSLPHSLYLGGSNNAQYLPLNLKELGSFVGCIQKLEVNGRSIAIISEAVGGTNVDNCPHSCTSKPCGPLAQCVPNLESYECQCNPSNLQCNKAEELSVQQTHSGPISFNFTDVLDNRSSISANDKNVLASFMANTSTTASALVSNVQISPALTSVQTNLPELLKPTTSTMANELRKYNAEVVATLSLSNSKSPVVQLSDPHAQSDKIVAEDYIDNKRNNNENYNFSTISSGISGSLREDADDANAYYYYDDDYEYKNGDSSSNGVVNIRTSPSPLPSSTTTAAVTAPTTVSTITERLTVKPLGISTDDDVTKVFGRYMTIDTDKLLKKEQMLKNKQLKASTHKSVKPPKKHYIPMPLLEPQSPHLADDEIEIDIMLPTTKNDHLTTTVKAIESEKPATVNDKNEKNNKHDQNDGDDDEMSSEFDAVGFYSNEDVLTTKELIDDMARIMKNGAEIRRNQMNNHRTKYVRKSHGACFTGADSYFHYNDAETMKQIISYKIELNLRLKTHSHNGLILWTGRHTAQVDDDYLLLGIENGYLHLRYNLGSGEVNIVYNTTKVSDGLWHRIRILRNLQDGSIEVDGGVEVSRRSPGKLRQLNTDTGLYVGGMPDIMYYTGRRYYSGIIGCISEIVLGGELKLSLDPETLGLAHNVEPGYF